MTRSIAIDEIVNEVKAASNLSLAEKFIEVTRPLKLSDVQAVSLFKQVKMRLQQRAVPRRNDPVSAPENWALLPC
jgi:hypothetical protein